MCGVERSGKCFCPPLTPQRDGDYKGRGTPLPVCARLFTACLRCTSLWHCAGLPVGIARCAGTIDPGSKECVFHTRPGWPSDGWPDGALRSGRKGTAQLNVNGLGAQWIHAVSTNRLKAQCMQQLTLGLQPNVGMLCLMNGLGPIGSLKVVWPSFDPLRSTPLTLVVLLASLRSITGARHGG